MLIDKKFVQLLYKQGRHIVLDVDIMNKKKHSQTKQKIAWDCYVRRLTSPIAIHHPTKEEKVMLQKAGYIVK